MCPSTEGVYDNDNNNEEYTLFKRALNINPFNTGTHYYLENCDD
ncbi:hypothetical protein E2C01_014491 [Portunus trituberculatus]|uniref:Uncharacterized protein n=1 Tax=Portunus trituberculatus TaxID=210409 RepID=A0A5B7DIZ1_PORTR|nr:hypothetical protein [Portunus trituberculatus]